MRRAADGKVAVEVEVVEPAGVDLETQVRVDGSVSATEVKGVITVRATVGCSGRVGMSCTLGDLVKWNPKGQHATNDAGAGFLYDELIFVEDGQCP